MSTAQDGHIGISFQQSFGTAYTSSLDNIPFINESLSEVINVITAEGITGRLEEGNNYEGAHDISGDIQFEVNPILIGKFLKAWTNNVSGSAVNSAFNHQFLPATTNWDNLAATPPMTINVYRGVDSSYQYYDMLLNTLTLEYNFGELNKATASFIGGKFAWVNEATPSFDSSSCLLFDQASISLAGNGLTNMSQLTMVFNNNLEAMGTLNGTKFPGRVKRAGYRTVEVTGSVFFDDDTETRDAWQAQALQRLIATVEGQTTAVSYSNTLKVDIPKMLYTDAPVNIGGPGELEISFTAQAKYDETSDYITEFTVVNTKASYV
jgi:hypothetical protein